MDFNSLIGLDEQKARQVLIENGYNNIETKENSKDNDLCDTKVVCAVRETENKITLICGEFYLNIGEK
jgi:hypothetical protein